MCANLARLIFRYYKKYQWLDSTIAYNQVDIREGQGFPLCGLMVAPYTTVTMHSCRSRDMARILCQVTQTDHAKAASILAGLSVLVQSASPRIANITCKDNHITHSFLACDVSSKCWNDGGVAYVSSVNGWDVPSDSWCHAPIKPLPPAFMCKNAGQRVPYTLVCDHRADCIDQSDEDFCDFPPCLLTQRTCGEARQEVCMYVCVHACVRVRALTCVCMCV